MNFVKPDAIPGTIDRGILPLGIAEDFWRSSATPDTIQALLSHEWRPDLDPDAVDRAGKLGRIYIDQNSRFALDRPKPRTFPNCSLHRYARPGRLTQLIATGSYEALCHTLRTYLERYEAHYWPGGPYEIAAFSDDPNNWDTSGYVIKPASAEVRALFLSNRTVEAS